MKDPLGLQFKRAEKCKDWEKPNKGHKVKRSRAWLSPQERGAKMESMGKIPEGTHWPLKDEGRQMARHTGHSAVS